MDFVLPMRGDFKEATQVFGLDSSRLLFKWLFKPFKIQEKYSWKIIVISQKANMNRKGLKLIKIIVKIRKDIRKLCYYIIRFINFSFYTI